ncbi:MAG: hypothetical protein M1368_09720, partial [Thaumarchaeota archaeon]|nr:hypothetical protein [Nitrososphaerota archaeon]
MSNNTRKLDAAANQLILDMKALALLSQNEEELVQILNDRIVRSHDEHISKFMSMLQMRKKTPGRLGPFLIALGELVLASFLSIGGLSLLAPSLI